jgi:hypothetical protein
MFVEVAKIRYNINKPKPTSTNLNKHHFFFIFLCVRSRALFIRAKAWDAELPSVK